MQKTLFKFVLFELVERFVRLRLLLQEASAAIQEAAPVLYKALSVEADELEKDLLSQSALFNPLFADADILDVPTSKGYPLFLNGFYAKLQHVSSLLYRLKQMHCLPETHLFLKEVLPPALMKDAGEISVFLGPEGGALPFPHLPQVMLSELSVLQKNNPLAWVSLARGYTHSLLLNANLEAFKLDLVRGEKKKTAASRAGEALHETVASDLLMHALNLRLLGPAYYFHALAEACLQENDAFMRWVEPALFFGLNHQNVAHKSLVILHEACERQRAGQDASVGLSESILANLYRIVEKTIPAKYAFQEKNMQHAIQLQERLGQGVLISSTSLFPVEEVGNTYEEARTQSDFSIYHVLSQLTELPHTPKEIINAGWLQKMERSPVWLYSVLNEQREQGLQNVMALLDLQDNLLCKSIETSEIHRVLLSSNH